jgi:hypothetical protein
MNGFRYLNLGQVRRQLTNYTAGLDVQRGVGRKFEAATERLIGAAMRAVVYVLCKMADLTRINEFNCMPTYFWKFLVRVHKWHHYDVYGMEDRCPLSEEDHSRIIDFATYVQRYLLPRYRDIWHAFAAIKEDATIGSMQGRPDLTLADLEIRATQSRRAWRLPGSAIQGAFFSYTYCKECFVERAVLYDGLDQLTVPAYPPAFVDLAIQGDRAALLATVFAMFEVYFYQNYTSTLVLECGRTKEESSFTVGGEDEGDSVPRADVCTDVITDHDRETIYYILGSAFRATLGTVHAECAAPGISNAHPTAAQEISNRLTLLPAIGRQRSLPNCRRTL